eukprot:6121749-Amphidinium_carterae.1
MRHSLVGTVASKSQVQRRNWVSAIVTSVSVTSAEFAMPCDESVRLPSTNLQPSSAAILVISLISSSAIGADSGEGNCTWTGLSAGGRLDIRSLHDCTPCSKSCCT